METTTTAETPQELWCDIPGIKKKFYKNSYYKTKNIFSFTTRVNAACVEKFPKIRQFVCCAGWWCVWESSAACPSLVTVRCMRQWDTVLTVVLALPPSLLSTLPPLWSSEARELVSGDLSTLMHSERRIGSWSKAHFWC